ncbi:MAG: ribonuclease P protein component [Saprospiraceae bacterium]|nr:ribonuclease P protein component [Saprospiraceae bacterium]
MKGRYSFPRSERLKSSSTISELFQKGHAISLAPLFARYRIREEPVNGSNLQIAFTVSKKNFQKAVTRNRIKRLMREAFRLHAPPLRDKLRSMNKCLELVIVFGGKELPDYETVEKKMTRLLGKIENG